MVRRITHEIMGVKSSQNDTAVFFFVKTRKERIRMPEECELLNAFPDISFCSPACPLQMLQ